VNLSSSKPGYLWWGKRLILFAVIFLALIKFVDFSLIAPHGRGDAWSMWNLKARFMNRLGIVETLTDQEAFDTAFSPVLIGPDRPLLLPLLTASGWRLFSNDTQAIPISIALFFTFGTGAVLYLALSYLKMPNPAWLLTLLLFVTPNTISQGSSQLADVPFGFFVLITVAALTFYEREQRPKWLLAATLATGLALSTKNEGAFLIPCLAVGYFRLWRQPRRTAGVVLGLLPFVLGFVAIKLAVDAPNEIVGQGQGTATFERLVDPARYETVARVFWRELDWFALASFLSIAYLLFSQPRLQWRFTAPLLIVALLLIGYFFIFIITPRPIPWHVEVSLPRLVFHLWPTALFGYALSTQPHPSNQTA
jgi:4-amino-4-deoxy-L-arabinose transferase-like glycosyltransferase